MMRGGALCDGQGPGAMESEGTVGGGMCEVEGKIMGSAQVRVGTRGEGERVAGKGFAGHCPEKGRREDGSVRGARCVGVGRG